MNKYNKNLEILFMVLGVISLIYYIGLRTFNSEISFSQFWLVLGIILILTGCLKGKNKYIFSKFKVVGKMVKIILCLIVIFFVMVEIPILYNGNKNYKGKSDYVIVLGAGLKGRTMSLTLYQRVERALEYIKQNPDAKIIVSGGKGPDEEITEAEAMEKFFLENGINQNRIIKEDRSRNTYQNLLFSYRKLQQVEGKSDKDIKNLKIAVVTSNFHVFRAKFLGKRVGMNLEGVSSKTMIFLQPNFYAREAIAVVKSILFDR